MQLWDESPHDVRMALAYIVMALRSYGLYGYGQCSYGLYGYGLRSCCLYSYGGYGYGLIS